MLTASLESVKLDPSLLIPHQQGGLCRAELFPVTPVAALCLQVFVAQPGALLMMCEETRAASAAGLTLLVYSFITESAELPLDHTGIDPQSGWGPSFENTTAPSTQSLASRSTSEGLVTARNGAIQGWLHPLPFPLPVLLWVSVQP